MKTYISILRSINVGGQKIIKMADLLTLYNSLGFVNCKTYIQSGNVVFKAKEKDAQKLSKLIVKTINEQFGFWVPVIVIELNNLMQIITANPFVINDNIDTSHLHITFLENQPNTDDIDLLNQYKDPIDSFVIINQCIYLHCPNGYGNTKLHNVFFEKKLKQTATTRNWKTVNELLKLATCI